MGKIGTNSPTYIQPVSERSDGIKSFFQKQQASPAAKGAKNVKEEPSSPLKGKAEPETGEPDTKITPSDDEKGLGDDSNAPNPQTQDAVKHESRGRSPLPEASIKAENQSSSKRKREAPEEVGKSGTEGRKGGHQTQVVRKTSQDDDKKEVLPAFWSTGHG